MLLCKYCWNHTDHVAEDPSTHYVSWYNLFLVLCFNLLMHFFSLRVWYNIQHVQLKTYRDRRTVAAAWSAITPFTFHHNKDSFKCVQRELILSLWDLLHPPEIQLKPTETRQQLVRYSTRTETCCLAARDGKNKNNFWFSRNFFFYTFSEMSVQESSRDSLRGDSFFFQEFLKMFCCWCLSK